MRKVIKRNEYYNEASVTDRSDFARNDRTQEQAQAALNKAFEKAKQIVFDAQKSRADLIKQTKEQMDEEFIKMKQQAHDEGFAFGSAEGKKSGLDLGYKEGYQDGLKNAAAENKQVLQELSQMLEEIELKKDQILKDFAEDIKILALNIAKKIIKREITLDDQTMLNIIKSATESYRNQSWVKIYVSKTRSATLLQADNNIIDALAAVSGNVKVITKPNMSDFDAVIEMPDQIIDAGVDVQVKNIESAIDIANPQKTDMG